MSSEPPIEVQQEPDDFVIPNVDPWEAAQVWARIGLLSFGGPAGQIALMHRILVDEKKWISEPRFLHALNFCMLLPGPEAQQLATYVGWLLHRIRGGLVAGFLFIIPGFFVILALSYVYVSAGDISLVQGLFVGLKAAVIIIVLQAVIRIGERSFRSRSSMVLAITAFLAMFVWRVPFPFVILVAAVVGALIAHKSPRLCDDRHVESKSVEASYVFRCVTVFGVLWLAPTLALIAALGPGNVFSNIGMFFSKMAVVTFGGAYAVLAYVSQEAVQTYGWLAPGEMIDGLAMAETTPGPLIMVTQYVGFLAAFRDSGAMSAGLAGLLGGLLTTWVTFVPCFLWIFVGAPYIERLRQNRLLSGALAGVTAAVVGVVVNLALWFSIHALFARITVYRVAGAVVEVPILGSLHLTTLLITLIAALLVFRFRASVPTTLTVTGVLGVVANLG